MIQKSQQVLVVQLLVWESLERKTTNYEVNENQLVKIFVLRLSTGRSTKSENTVLCQTLSNVEEHPGVLRHYFLWLLSLRRCYFPPFRSILNSKTNISCFFSAIDCSRTNISSNKGCKAGSSWIEDLRSRCSKLRTINCIQCCCFFLSWSHHFYAFLSNVRMENSWSSHN